MDSKPTFVSDEFAGTYDHRFGEFPRGAFWVEILVLIPFVTDEGLPTCCGHIS